MLLYHFPLTSSSATATIVNKGLKDDYAYNGNSTFSSGGKLSSYAKYIDNNNAFKLTISNFTTNHTLCLRVNSESRYYVCYINGVGISNSEINLENGSWYDVVITSNKVYVNGSYVKDYNYTNGNVTIGITNSFRGLIQDVRIYDHTLSQAEINEYSRALVVHYPLQGNELNPSVLKDVSGFGNDIILKSDDCFNSITDFVRGNKIQQCRSKFLGTDMRQSGGTAYGQTISFWVRQNFATASMSGIWTYLFTHRIYDGENSDFSYLANGAGRQALWNNKNSINMPLTAGNLYHIAIVYNGTTRKVYANGSAYNTSNVTLNSFNIKYILMGNGGNDPRYDKCISIVDYRIYATALSAEDIKNLYNSPISVSKQHQTMAFEFKENPLYPSKYWRTPTYDEMNYILNTRTNAANLRTLGRVEISSGVYRNGLFLLPDGFTAPSGITVTITTANYTTNSYTLAQFKQLESVGVVFLPETEVRNGTTYEIDTWTYYSLTNEAPADRRKLFRFYLSVGFYDGQKMIGQPVRLCKSGSQFSVSATTKIDFAPANLQYHCTQHIWRFAEHSYDIIGADNANISDSYNGWIDLFGYGTSGVNYSPTLHTNNNADYASGDISNTDNDWGINEIQSYEYNVKNFAANKNGILQHNELRENNSEVNGCYNDKLITNELIEN